VENRNEPPRIGRLRAQYANRLAHLHGVFRLPLLAIHQRIIGAALRPNSNPGHPAGRPVVAGFRAAWRGTTSTTTPRIPPGLRYARKLRVRNHPLYVRSVSRTDLNRLAKLPHSARRLRAQQMTLAGMGAHNLACRGHSESLGCAAMRLQLSNFCFRFRHDCTFSENF